MTEVEARPAVTVHHCEWCGRPMVGGFIEVPQDMIARAELEELYVEDPSCLRFCSPKCKDVWFAKRRGAQWEEHGSLCLCVGCLR